MDCLFSTTPSQMGTAAKMSRIEGGRTPGERGVLNTTRFVIVIASYSCGILVQTGGVSGKVRGGGQGKEKRD